MSVHPWQSRRRLTLRGSAGGLAPERALVSVETMDADRRGVAERPGPRELIAVFVRMALARDLEAQRGRTLDSEAKPSETETT